MVNTCKLFKDFNWRWDSICLRFAHFSVDIQPVFLSVYHLYLSFQCFQQLILDFNFANLDTKLYAAWSTEMANFFQG